MRRSAKLTWPRKCSPKKVPRRPQRKYLPPQTDQGKEYLEENEEEPRPLRLMTYHEVTPRVPVYIIYYTAYPNPATGIVQTWPDLYGYDKAIASAIDSFLPK